MSPYLSLVPYRVVNARSTGFLLEGEQKPEKPGFSRYAVRLPCACALPSSNFFFFLSHLSGLLSGNGEHNHAGDFANSLSSSNSVGQAGSWSLLPPRRTGRTFREAKEAVGMCTVDPRKRVHDDVHAELVCQCHTMQS